jgi:hypothetical protein
MKPLAILLVLCGALLAGGCGSKPHASSVAPASHASVGAHPECVCGTHEAQIHGCHAPECASGQGNPDNPKCFCKPLTPAAPAKGS